MKTSNSRRKLLLSGLATGAGLATPALLRAQSTPQNLVGDIVSDEVAVPSANSHKFNTASYRTQHWQDHFSNTNGGAILVDMPAFALHYWNEPRTAYRLYPIAVPLRNEFERRGFTTVTRKVDGPEWRPTANMLSRDPDLPKYVGPGPQNPLGTHALYLGWQYYRIHGNNDQRKIGRRSSNGCIGLYNNDIAELFGMVDVGCQVKMI